MSEILVLKTKKELDIFMNPTRQWILREFRRAGEPVTPKFLSDRLNISPSSIQFHIKKLVEIGLVVLDHTEMIRGIQAKFYTLSDVVVSLYGSGSEYFDERELAMESCFMSVYENYKKALRENKDIVLENWKSHAAAWNGVAFLTEEDSLELFTLMQDFLVKHSKKEPGTIPWEYGLVAYKMDN